MKTLKTILTIILAFTSLLLSKPVIYTFEGIITRINSDESSILSSKNITVGSSVTYKFEVDTSLPAMMTFNYEPVFVERVKQVTDGTVYKFLIKIVSGNLYPNFRSDQLHKRLLSAFDLCGNQFTYFKNQEIDGKQEWEIRAGSVDKLFMEIGDSLSCKESYNRNTTINGTESVLNNSYISRICLVSIDDPTTIKMTNKILTHNFKQKSTRPSIRIVLGHEKSIPSNIVYDLKGRFMGSLMGSRGTYIFK